jgi:hypothetical protein
LSGEKKKKKKKKKKMKNFETQNLALEEIGCDINAPEVM